MRIAYSLVLFLLFCSSTFAQIDNKSNIRHLSADQWHEDLQYFARELPKLHANAFHYVSKEQFEEEIAKLDSQLGRLNDDEIYVKMNCIAKLIGDAHTYINYPPDKADFPINFGYFNNEYRIISAPSVLEHSLGAKVLSVEQVPISQVVKTSSKMTPQDENPDLDTAYITDLLTTGLILHGFDIIPDRNLVHYTLMDDTGKIFSIEVHAISASDISPIKLVQMVKNPPLYHQNPFQKCWSKYLQESKTVYFNVRSMRAKALRKPSKEMLRLVKYYNAEKLVIDLRQNGGGDYFKGHKFLIRPIKRNSLINKKGHLFVLIGPLTFSAAMVNAAQFDMQTEAILAGQTIGEKPNSYQEPRQSILPNSKLIFRYSTKYYKFVEGENVIKPEYEIIPSWLDYKNSLDPVLDWVLTLK